MSQDVTALLALKSAWAGAIAASDRLRELAPDVAGLGDESSIRDLDLDTYRAAALALANAAQALRGLVEGLQTRATTS